MPLDLKTGLLLAMVPGLAGWAVHGMLMFRARGNRATPLPRESFGPFLVLLILPASAPIFGLVAAILAATPSETGDSIPAGDFETPLLVLGIAGFLTAVAQGVIASRGIATLRPETFGKLLVRTVLPETILLLALVYFLFASGLANDEPASTAAAFGLHLAAR